MNIFDSTLLMEYNAEELFGNIIFNDAAQTEKIIFTDVVNDVIFEKEYPLGTSFIQSCNCGTDIFKQLKNDVLNYTINNNRRNIARYCDKIKIGTYFK